MTINQIKASNHSIKYELEANPDAEKKRSYSETNSSDQQENDPKKAKSEKPFEADFFQKDRSLFIDKQFKEICQKSSLQDQDRDQETHPLEASSDPVFDNDLFSLPFPKIDLSTLSPKEAILELEKLEKSIPSNYPHENNDSYFYTAKTNKILDPKDPLSSRYITVLTGELEPHLIPLNATEGLKTNLKIAKELNDRIKNLIPFSENFLQRARIFSKDYYNSNHVTIVRQALALIRKNRRFLNLNPMQHTEIIFEHKTGNCSELTLAGLFLGKNVIRIGIFGADENEDGDHDFLILGYPIENPSIKNIDPKALIRNRNAVICDLWTRANFPASMLEQYLFDSILDGVILNGMKCAKVKIFDSSKQKLSILYN